MCLTKANAAASDSGIPVRGGGGDQTQTAFSTSEGFPDQGRGELINRASSGRLKSGISSLIWRSILSERAFASSFVSLSALRLFQEVKIPI